MNEEGSRTGLEYNQRPKPTRLSLARPRDALLDHATAEMGGNQSSFGIPYRLTQRGIADAGLLRKARERLVLEYRTVPALTSLDSCTGKYNTKCYR
jgi:hypothetical protein